MVRNEKQNEKQNAKVQADEGKRLRNGHQNAKVHLKSLDFMF